jgi:hypothetical protein
MLVPTKPWEEVLRFYRDRERSNAFFHPMHQLVEHIAAQPYASSIFCTTSMHALLVAQHETIEWGHDVLRVELSLSGGLVTFAFQEQPDVKPVVWTCPREDIVGTFDGFLRRAKWVSLAR